ncbi:hypothetical protein LG288_05900 [Idiomarina seosinensis]|uniref:hypothetical protein n=1 Tax=Idiomarina seosinensis TaxID=281739 RepID=UPI00384F5617
MAVAYPQNQTMPASDGGFLNGLGDVFLGGMQSYLKIREAEKRAEISGEAQYYNDRALEYTSSPNAQPQRTGQQQTSQGESSQWINGVDNSVVILGGAGALALALILTR